MTYLKRTGFYVAVAVLLAITAAFCISATAISQSRVPNEAMIAYEKEQMQQYSKELRTYLTELGYNNSGVTLTRTTQSDGSKFYTAKIHHTRIDKMDEYQREELLALLATISVSEPQVTVYHEFLVIN